MSVLFVFIGRCDGKSDVVREIRCEFFKNKLRIEESELPNENIKSGKI